jgi:hypothetical protein
MTAARGALGILVVRKRLATQILLGLRLPLQSLTYRLGNQVVLTSIMSTIPYVHVHSVFSSVCVAPTFKLLHLKIGELSTPQTHELGKGVSKIILKFPHEVIFRTRNYGTLLLAFLFFVRVFWESPSTWSLIANLDDLVASIPFLLAKWKQYK